LNTPHGTLYLLIDTLLTWTLNWSWSWSWTWTWKQLAARIQIAALNFNCVSFELLVADKTMSQRFKFHGLTSQWNPQSEFVIVLLRFTLVDKLNNESHLDRGRTKGKKRRTACEN